MKRRAKAVDVWGLGLEDPSVIGVAVMIGECS